MPTPATACRSSPPSSAPACGWSAPPWTPTASRACPAPTAKGRARKAASDRHAAARAAALGFPNRRLAAAGLAPVRPAAVLYRLLLTHGTPAQVEREGHRKSRCGFMQQARIHG